MTTYEVTLAVRISEEGDADGNYDVTFGKKGTTVKVPRSHLIYALERAGDQDGGYDRGIDSEMMLEALMEEEGE